MNASIASDLSPSQSTLTCFAWSWSMPQARWMPSCLVRMLYERPRPPRTRTRAPTCLQHETDTRPNDMGALVLDRNASSMPFRQPICIRTTVLSLPSHARCRLSKIQRTGSTAASHPTSRHEQRSSASSESLIQQCSSERATHARSIKQPTTPLVIPCYHGSLLILSLW